MIEPMVRVYPLSRTADHWYADHSMCRILSSKTVSSIAMNSISKLSKNMRSGKRKPRSISTLQQERVSRSEPLLASHISMG
jgi:hypothetical protein